MYRQITLRMRTRGIDRLSLCPLFSVCNFWLSLQNINFNNFGDKFAWRLWRHAMHIRIRITRGLLVCGLTAIWLPLAVLASNGSLIVTRATIVYDRAATEVNAAIDSTNDLWVTRADLTKAT